MKILEEELLNKRYRNDGESLTPLNDLQLKIKNQIHQKVADGIYKYEKANCAVCDLDLEERARTISQKERNGYNQNIVLCKNCGLIQNYPRLNQSSYNEYYEKEFISDQTGMNDEEFLMNIGTLEYYEKRGKRIMDYVFGNTNFDTKKVSVLEVGCSAGSVIKPFKDMGCKVKGIDLRESFLSFGKKKYGLDLEVGTLNSVVLNEKPHIIIYSHVLEHILDIKNELSKVRQLLRDDGVVYIEVPGVRNIRSAYNGDFLSSLQLAHINYFTLTTLTNLLNNNGFELFEGNEVIESLFVRQKNKSSYITTNEYPEILIFLKKTELLRKIKKFMDILKVGKLFNQLIQVLGLKNLIKKLLNI